MLRSFDFGKMFYFLPARAMVTKFGENNLKETTFKSNLRATDDAIIARSYG